LEFNVPFQHKYGYIKDDSTKCGKSIGTREQRWGLGWEQG